MKSIINAFIWSSVNPNKISLTIKAGVPFIAATLAFMNIDFDINPLIDAILVFINGLIVLVTAGVTMFGLARKLAIQLMR